MRNVEEFEKISEKINDPRIHLINGMLHLLLGQESKTMECFKNSQKDILGMFTTLDKEDWRTTAITNVLYQLLDSSSAHDALFFRKVTEKVNKENLDKCKKIYILSILIVSQLHINSKNERFVAHYTTNAASQEMLSLGSRFRLNATNRTNDPMEGAALLDCLSMEKIVASEIQNMEYGAFAGCFTFNYDDLNQFRLYGKEGGIEGTGLSLVFRDSFFSEKAKPATIQLSAGLEQGSEPLWPEEKEALFRCMYVDPKTQQVEAVGHKEKDFFIWRGRMRRIM